MSGHSTAGLTQNVSLEVRRVALDLQRRIEVVDDKVDANAAAAAVLPIWTAVAFQNSFSNFGGAWQTIQYRKENGRVHVRGMAHRTTATTGLSTMFTLPAGFRPPTDTMLTCISFNRDGTSIELAIRVDVNTAGNFIIPVAVAAGFWIHFNHSFAAA